ncbi:hypothetical protein [uncultured Megamonas sp.]|uniref:hypothetical protein n=1 Tax=uncultured Megamonas sp. TaxID=286140 RepID=UPI002596B472|nr:hypothetical protein [uncultured Megamonas sp.]
MIRIADIQDKLLHLVGWKQNYDLSNITLSDNLTQTESGMYFQQIHPLLTLDNLQSIAPDFQNYNWQVYDTNKAYKSGEVVRIEDSLYKALQNVPIKTSISDTDYWVETNPFSEWLEDKTKASIVKLVNKFINMKLADKASKSLIENKTLFDGTGRLANKIENRNRLVGFEIDTVRSKGVTVKIDKIGLQMTEPGSYTLYIFHSSNPEPIYTLTFEKTKANSLEWFKPKDDILLPYESVNTDAGGSWYLVYKQSELPENAQAIYKDRDWSTGPCKACSRSEFLAYQAWSKYIEVHPFYISEDEEFDPEAMNFTYDKNYGINLEVSAYCDLTDFIIKQRAMFQDVLSKQVAIDFLREFAYNPNVRTNRHSINASKLDILAELDGDSSSMRQSGLSYELDIALKALSISTQGLDRICLPCVNNGIKYRSI